MQFLFKLVRIMLSSKNTKAKFECLIKNFQKKFNLLDPIYAALKLVNHVTLRSYQSKKRYIIKTKLCPLVPIDRCR